MKQDYDFPEILANLNPIGPEAILWKSRGQIPLIKETDIAYLLSRPKIRGAVYLLRIKYADQDWWKQLELELWEKATDIAVKQKWPKLPHDHPLVGKEFRRTMCRLAIWENINNHRCPGCLGRGGGLIDHQIVTCNDCSGSGRTVPTDETRASYLANSTGVGEMYFGNWKSQYSTISGVLVRWERHGLRMMHRALFGGND